MQGMIQVNFPTQWEKANKIAPVPAVKPKAAAPKKAAKAKVAPKKAKK
jgi:hypothetical protein